MSEKWELSQIQSFLPDHSKSRLYATSKAISIATSLLPARPDLLQSAKQVLPLPAKLNPPPPASSLWSQFHLYLQSRIHHYQLAPREVRLSERYVAPSKASFTPTSEDRSTTTSEYRSTATSLLPARHDQLLLVMPDSPYQRSQIHHYRLALSEGWLSERQVSPSKASFIPTSEDRYTTTSLLPERPDLLLSAKPDSALPVKPDPPLPACSKRGQIDCYQGCEFHP